jgi:putative membrane protein
MLYLPSLIIGLTPLFAYITFSTDILYPTYEYAPRLPWTGLDAAGDQLLAGCMMELIGMSVAMIAFATSFYRWYQAGEAAGAKK